MGSKRIAITRRELLKTTGLVAAGAGLAGLAHPAAAASSAPSPNRQRVLRIGHLTDMHIRPTGRGPTGLVACLEHVQSLSDRPDIIFNGGDAIMSALGADKDSTRAQWEIWHKIMNENLELPMIHCIGNHDVWGWQRSRAGTTGDEPLYGKAWVKEELELESGFYSFDKAGWHFTVLDSVRERGGGAYQPLLEEDQIEWLKADLDAVPTETPILILSHVPVISVTPYFFYDDIVENYQFRVAGALMHQDVHRLRDLFANYPNIKVCLSGHVHLVDRVDYNGITYLCNGAVSGSWWHGRYQDCEPGYALVDLYDDGSFEREYIEYEWDVGE